MRRGMPVRIRKIVLKSYIALALATVFGAQCSIAFAEQTIEEVVVVGKSIKASTQSSIDAKRMADNVADVISADAVGRFPDQNLADALGRVPGISIERDQGQARYVSFRGSPKRYTTTAFNGVDVPGVENGRIPRFDAYPSVIASQVVANKAITADMPGESVSGYINVKTFAPGDTDGWAFSMEVGTGEQDLGGGDVSKANARLSYSNDKFGFLIYGSENTRNQVTDNREMDYLGSAGALVPKQIEFRNYLLERKDEAYGGSLEFYLDNGGKVYASTTNTKFTDVEQRNHWYFYFPAGLPAQSGVAPTVDMRNLLEYGFYDNQTNVNTLGADFSFGEWDIEAKYSDIETVNDTWLPLVFLNGKGGSPELTDVAYDFSNKLEPILLFDEDLGDVRYPTNLTIDAIGALDIDTDQFKFDASRANKWGLIKVGFKYDARDAEGGGAPLQTIASGPHITQDQIALARTGPWDTDLANTIGATYVDNKAIFGQMVADGLVKPSFRANEALEIEETILSAYLMQTLDMEWGNIVLGVRVEDTDYETIGIRLEGAVAQPLKVSQSYTNVLPSAHVNWDFREDQKLRFSFSTGISRPTYIEARAAGSISEIGEAVSGGNPDLDEERSWGIDVAWEWYFNDASILSVTAFHRSIDNVIAESTVQVAGSIYSDTAGPGDLWDLSSFDNGKDGKLQGIEFAYTARLDNYIEGFWSGFGVEANATIVDSEYTTPAGLEFDLPGQSDLTYNISLFYEDHGLMTRLSYRYRDQWQDETETGAVFGFTEAIYWDEQSRLDLSMRYDLEPWIGHKASLFLNVNNLSDENDSRFAGKSWKPTQNETYGRRYLVGVRFSL
ncbi:MAG: TonB-dependent receptor [Candidatus Azotimanducaceae bacterium]|jgi:TonB-dependent receptor